MQMINNQARWEKNARLGFKYFNKGMVLLWKLGLADWINVWPTLFGQIMVLSHTGRKSGYRRLTPVNYAILDEEIYCCAGFGAVSDWYQNILKNPQVEIWLTEGRWLGKAEDVSEHPDRRRILREVLIASGFAAPLFGIHPKQLNDAEIDQLTRSYRLIHIVRIDEKTGRDGPGELAWIWPLITVILLFRKGRRIKETKKR
ncbi:MAG: hypothetical protein BGO78_08015 [Chloroflexi bacterium 44-23]|nr:MAG: hypothetical protein BGO78_08015 [Chloroflexi bacterium 44-23]